MEGADISWQCMLAMDASYGYKNAADVKTHMQY